MCCFSVILKQLQFVPAPQEKATSFYATLVMMKGRLLWRLTSCCDSICYSETDFFSEDFFSTVHTIRFVLCLHANRSAAGVVSVGTWQMTEAKIIKLGILGFDLSLILYNDLYKFGNPNLCFIAILTLQTYPIYLFLFSIFHNESTSTIAEPSNKVTGIQGNVADWVVSR